MRNEICSEEGLERGSCWNLSIPSPFLFINSFAHFAHFAQKAERRYLAWSLALELSLLLSCSVSCLSNGRYLLSLLLLSLVSCSQLTLLLIEWAIISLVSCSRAFNQILLCCSDNSCLFRFLSLSETYGIKRTRPPPSPSHFPSPSSLFSPSSSPLPPPPSPRPFQTHFTALDSTTLGKQLGWIEKKVRGK